MKTQPTTSYLNIREYAERWTWRDPKTGQLMKGFNPPEGVPAERVPFRVLAVSESGHRVEGLVVCIKVNTRLQTRLLKWVEPIGDIKRDDIKWVFDKFIVEIDGTRFITH